MAFPDDLLFDPEKCEVGSVEKVNFDFISDCTICPAPEPVFDCPDLEIPPEFPIPTPPCPTFAASAAADASVMMDVYVFTPPNPPPQQPTVSVSASAGVQVSTISGNGGACNVALDFFFSFDFMFELVIPVPVAVTFCPIISAHASTTVSCTTNFNAAAVNVNVTQVPINPGSSLCEYLFDFDFVLPVCDFTLLVGGVTTTTLPPSAEASVAVTISNSGSCACGATVDFDFYIPRGFPGSNGSDGMDGDKYAIVPLEIPLPTGEVSSAGYAGLMCVEQPETRFEDVMKLWIHNTADSAKIDPRYLAVCEPGSIQVVGVAPERPVPVGVNIRDGEVVVVTGPHSYTGFYVTVKLSGIRKGRRGIRFPTFSREEREKNTTFWNAWNSR